MRLDYIDIAKGFAILTVLIGHILIYDVYGFNDAWNFSKLVKLIYSFHMPLFIFLSGLVISTPNKYNDIKDDVYKRFRLLIVPFFIIGSIYSFIIESNLSFVFNEMKYGYWYLLILFYYYLFNYLSIKIKRYPIVIVYVFVCLIFWKGISYLNQFINNDIKNIFSTNLFILYFPYFMIGSIIKKIGLYNIFSISPVVYFIILLITKNINIPYIDYINNTLLILFIISICKIISEARSNITNILSIIGKDSLYLYVFHYFFLNLFDMSFLRKWMISNNVGIYVDFLIIIIPLIIMLVLCYIVKFIISSNTFINKFIFYK